MFSRAICCNIRYKIDIRHVQNSENEQKKKKQSPFFAIQTLNDFLKKKQNNCFRQSFHMDHENVTNTATLSQILPHYHKHL